MDGARYWASRKLSELETQLRELANRASDDVSVMIVQALEAIEECRSAIAADNAPAAALSMAEAVEHHQSAHFAVYHHADWLAGKRVRRAATQGGASKGGKARAQGSELQRREAVRLATEYHDANPHIKSRRHVARQIAPKLDATDRTVDSWLEREGWRPSR